MPSVNRSTADTYGSSQEIDRPVYVPGQFRGMPISCKTDIYVLMYGSILESITKNTVMLCWALVKLGLCTDVDSLHLCKHPCFYFPLSFSW